MSMQNRFLVRSLYHNIRSSSSRSNKSSSNTLQYSTTSSLLKAEPMSISTSASTSTSISRDDVKLQSKLAQNYNDRRAAYKRAVGKLRKQYADEVTQQRLIDEKAEAEERARLTRQRLERQRAKNIRSVKNAIVHEEARLKRAEEFEEHLKTAQIHREARAQRFDKARRLVVQELNDEAVHWMSTPEEVDAALHGTHNEQTLWGRPGGFVGAPMPSEDAEFWRFESHTWEMTKRYTTPREKFLEELLENAYFETNLKESFWNDDRIQFQTELEEKAKLRSLVRWEGRKALLMKQQEMMRDIQAQNKTTGPDGLPPVPKPMVVPSLKILADYEAMEEEGVKLLERDPSKFFVFDSSSVSSEDDEDADEYENENQGGHGHGHGQTSMGKPIGLRDPVRDASPTGTPYPEILGRVAKKDTRTQKEIKRQEREERMWAATQAEAASDVDNAAEEEVAESNEPTDYEKIGNFGDEEDLAWEEGLDPVKDAGILATPRDQRFSDDDVEWMKEELEKKISNLQEIVKREEQNDSQRLGLGGEAEVEDGAEAEAEVEDGTSDSMSIMDQKDLDFEDIAESHDTSVLDTLNEDQIAAMIALGEASQPQTPEEIKASLSKVPGLTDEQVESIVELEMSLLQQISNGGSDGNNKE